jgi:RNA polymerase subunit RPABC4/transcription elongation factor Spt4
MSQKICYSCEVVCNSTIKECPSCGTRLEAKVTGDFNPLLFIAAVCASFLMVGIMVGAAA